MPSTNYMSGLNEQCDKSAISVMDDNRNKENYPVNRLPINGSDFGTGIQFPMNSCPQNSEEVAAKKEEGRRGTMPCRGVIDTLADLN